MIGAIFMQVLGIAALFVGLFLVEETDVMLGCFVLGNTFSIIARLEMIERKIKEVAQ